MLKMRRMQDDADYWRIRDFLRQVFLLNGRRQMSWHIARLDYWWARRHEFLPDTLPEEVVFLWETQEGEIAAVLLPEHLGIAYQQVHPAMRSTDLEQRMLAVAEEHLTIEKEGQRRVIVVADQHDHMRQEVLMQRGYSRFEHPKAKEHQRRRSLAMPLPQMPLAAGYALRALQDGELEARGLAAWRTTRSDEPDNEFHAWQWLSQVSQAPLYRRDLDIVATGPDGDVASFCTLWFDDVTRSALFEPVGTVQAHQRKGLGKAVMLEALRRVRRMGATLALVSSYTPPAHALYASLGFEEYDLCEPWVHVR